MSKREKDVRAAFESALVMVEIYRSFNHPDASICQTVVDTLALAVEGGIMFAFDTARMEGGWHQDEAFIEWTHGVTYEESLREGLRRTLAHMSEEG